MKPITKILIICSILLLAFFWQLNKVKEAKAVSCICPNGKEYEVESDEACEQICRASEKIEETPTEGEEVIGPESPESQPIGGETGVGGGAGAGGEEKAPKERGVFTRGLTDKCMTEGLCGACDILVVVNNIIGFALQIVGGLAILALVISGVLYITSRGNPEQTQQAKMAATAAVVGTIIVLSTWLIITTIVNTLGYNMGSWYAPECESPLGVIEEEKGVEVGIKKGAEKTKCSSTNTTYDEIFKKYAPCTGLDWRVLKGIACKESGFNADIVNKYGYIGLFQTKRCPKGEPNCDLTNPETNTKAVTPFFKKATDEIKKRCPNVSTRDFLTLLYLAHNSGLGSLTGTGKVKGAIERGGCQGEKLKQGIIEFWEEHNVVKGFKEPVNGEKRYNYAQKVADFIIGPLAVENPFRPINGCPI